MVKTNPQRALGDEVGRVVAEALGLSDVGHIREILIRLPANEPATVIVSRFMPVGSTAIGVTMSQYQLVPKEVSPDGEG